MSTVIALNLDAGGTLDVSRLVTNYALTVHDPDGQRGHLTLQLTPDELRALGDEIEFALKH